MKIILSSIFAFLFYVSVAAQQLDPLQPLMIPNSEGAKNSLILSTDFFYGSNAMTNEFVQAYFLNRFITDELKDEVSKRLDNRNRLGGEFSTELYFRHKPDSLFGRTDLSWFIGLKNINHLNSLFSRDLFEVYFRGNKDYAGKIAGLADFNYLLLKYQQVQFGLSKMVKKDSTAFEMGAAIGFNIGQQLTQIHSPKADLYTEDFGEYLDVNATVEIHTSDSLRRNFGSFNGFGFSGDLFYKAELKNKHFLFARISNLGFIRWNKESVELKADSSFRFEGVDVSSLFNFSDSIQSTITLDSSVAEPFLSKRKYTSNTLFLPAKIEVSYMRAINNQWRAGIGVNYILSADYIPLVRLAGDYSWKKNLVGVTISYGGYTTFGAGIQYRRYFGHGYAFLVGSQNINSILNINTSTSESLRFTLFRNF